MSEQSTLTKEELDQANQEAQHLEDEAIEALSRDENRGGKKSKKGGKKGGKKSKKGGKKSKKGNKKSKKQSRKA